MKKQRCSFCNKKTGLIYFNCECGGIYCSNHRYQHSHKCKNMEDKKKKEKKNIENQNPKTESAKLQKC